MFRILIEETRTVEKDIGHRWVGKDEAPLTDGYTPPHVCKQQETIVRYEQRVDHLDIWRVAILINKPVPESSSETPSEYLARMECGK